MDICRSYLSLDHSRLPVAMTILYHSSSLIFITKWNGFGIGRQVGTTGFSFELPLRLSIFGTVNLVAGVFPMDIGFFFFFLYTLQESCADLCCCL